jgi:hypothetical protein
MSSFLCNTIEHVDERCIRSQTCLTGSGCGVDSTSSLDRLMLSAPTTSISTLRPPHVLKFVTSVLFLRRHIAMCFLSKDTTLARLGMYPKRVQNMLHLRDTILILETIVHFRSYTRYKPLHTRREDDNTPALEFVFFFLISCSFVVKSHFVWHQSGLCLSD